MAYIGNVPAEKYIALTQQTFSSPTGTSFTLSQAVTNSVDIDLYIVIAKLDPASYSVSGTALTTSTIASPSTMYCIFNGKAMQTVNPPDDSVGLAQLAGGTDGNIISFDASGNPVAVATGSDGQVLTSAGAGQPCAFETLTTGKVLQVVNTQSGALITTTTIMPWFDDTITQNTEGVELMTLAITPAHASNILEITVAAHISWGGATSNHTLVASLFQDSTANALATGAQSIYVANGVALITFKHRMASGTTSATTFKVRGGSQVAGTTSFNGSSGVRCNGGTMASSITITEIAV